MTFNDTILAYITWIHPAKTKIITVSYEIMGYNYAIRVG